jgi:hypothetical protein
MLVNVVPREKPIRSGWRYDSCGEVMSDLQAGWVEWLAAEDTKGKPESMASVTNSSFAHLSFARLFAHRTRR